MKIVTKEMKQIAFDYFGEKGFYSPSIKLSDVKGMLYSLDEISNGVFMAYNSITSGVFYNFFTVEEVREEKISLIGNSDMTMELSRKTKNRTERDNIEKKSREFFSLFVKDGLEFKTVVEDDRVISTLDMSSDKFPSNLVWSIITSSYKYKDCIFND